jgi:hypothetical protein
MEEEDHHTNKAGWTFVRRYSVILSLHLEDDTIDETEYSRSMPANVIR